MNKHEQTERQRAGRSDQEFKKTFPEVDFEGQASWIYRAVMSRRETPSCRQLMAQALREGYLGRVTAATPRMKIPRALFREIKRKEIFVPGPSGLIRCLVYHPHENETLSPVAVFIHGGGWIMQRPEDCDLVARKLALEAGIVVVSVDYRLAPEHPYPQGLDDCIAVYLWVRRNAETELRADPNRVIMAGESSGGNLAASATLRVRDAENIIPNAMLLLCPATDLRAEDYVSFRRLAPKGLLYDAGFVGFARSVYVSNAAEWDSPYVSPMRADLHGLCPTLIIAGTADPLLDDNRAFALKLRDAGNEVELMMYEDMPHAFYYFLGLTREEAYAYQAINDFLSRVLAPFAVVGKEA
jgi:acetyl esterase